MELVTLLGFLGAVLTTSCFVPQVVKIVMSRQTKDISLLMYVALVSGFSLWLAYGIILKNGPLILANSVSLTFALIILITKIRYG